MRFIELNDPLIVILGPTAVGKTEFSIRLAERIEGEIVSCDSRLFYKGMDIGTAKPSQQDMRRIPHHLIDVVEPAETWSLALFQLEVHRVIGEIKARNKTPILVGGTGQYIRAVIEEWELPPQPPDDSMRMLLAHWADQIGKSGLHDRLAVIDPKAAESIDPCNLRRTIRALEVILFTGRRFSDQRIKTRSRYDLFQVGLTMPREHLYQRIDARIDDMIGHGFVNEVKRLRELGYSEKLPAFSAIGYREIEQHISGKMTLEDAKNLIKRASRNFVRRQANWFKLSDPKIHWYDIENDPLEKIITDLRNLQLWEKCET